ncbi:hypothetical protein CRUP_033112, partial [Coryphaenoides rupestris]
MMAVLNIPEANMELDDYSFFSHLTDNELIQLAIERNSTKSKSKSTSQSKSKSKSMPNDFAEMQLMIHSEDEAALLAYVKDNPGCAEVTNCEGWTSLHEAAYFGQLGCLKILIETFPDMVNRCSPKNQTALLLATYRGQVSCVEYLLEHGADPQISNKEQESPLFKACEQRSDRMVELLLRSGASVNKLNDQGATAFQEATMHDHLKVCERLVQAGAKICTTNIYGAQPFFTAAQNGSINVLNFLLSKGVIVNKQVTDGATPLYEACKNGHTSVVEALLSHNADANLATKSGLLPLHTATRKTHKHIVSMLLPLTRKDRVTSSGISPLHLATERSRDDILELLIDAGYDVNSQLSEEHRWTYEDRRSTALYFAVHNNNLEAAEMLLEAGADPNLDFFSPLLLAVRKGNVELAALLARIATNQLSFPAAVLLGMNCTPLLKILMDHGCDARACFHSQPGMVNKRTLKDQSALLLAVSTSHAGCASLLLQAGADPELMNRERETPLYKACEQENAEIVALLLNHGTSVNTHCIQGWTALQEAVCRNNVEICEMLVKAGARLTPRQYLRHLAALHRGAERASADVDSQAADGATALYEATKNGHHSIVELLLSQKADANKPNKRGLLPLHIAAQRGDDIPLHVAAEHNMDDVLAMLIEAGFDVNARLSLEQSKMYEDRRTTALYFAVANNNVEAVGALLDAGADPNLDVFSPLLVAVRLGCVETVTMLVEHGADVNAYLPTHPTSFPATVLFAMKYLSMLKYILDHGCDGAACFRCSHGAGAHPPLKVNRFQRDELRYSESSMSLENTADNCVQFCEMVSIPSMCRWAGPIIDVLLDYVGHVKLCSRLLDHLDSYPEWQAIKEKATTPRPLMQLCRLAIRQLVGLQHLKKLQTLPLPGTLLRFLQYQESYT